MTETEWALIWIAWGLGVAEILNYFWISWEGLIIMSVMLLLDFIFWIVAAKVRWEKIESRKCQIGLIKKLSRWLLPFIVAAWLKWTWMWGIEMLITVIVGMIVFSELYSVIGHIYSINYKEELQEVDAFKMLLNSLVKILKNLINKQNDQIEPKEDLDSKEEKDGAKDSSLS